MHKFLFVLFLISTTFAVYAQSNEYNPYYQFVEGESYYLLADGVNIRQEANTKSTVISLIPIATELKILEKSDQSLLLKGFRAPWYKVAFTHEGKDLQGYIWGGFLARGIGTSTANEDVKFLYGISKVQKTMRDGYPYTLIEVQVRACKAHQELARLEVEGLGALATGLSSEVSTGKGISAIKDIISLSFSDGYCGGANGIQMVVWDGKKLHHLRKMNNYFDAPIFTHEYFIFPEDENGQAGKIILHTESGEYDDDGNPVYSEQNTQTYVWKEGLKAVEP